jgi:hypothetical protein
MERYKSFFESQEPKIVKVDTAQFNEIKDAFDESMNVYSINGRDSFYLAFSKDLSQSNVVHVFEYIENLGFDYFKELTEDEKSGLGIKGHTIIEVIPN